MAFGLNNQQKDAVFYNGEKPLLIEAGAGSGKTRVMTERVKYLIERGENPESILVCTFSTKAADELKNRLLKYALDDNEKITKSDIHSMHISTVHSFCISLLKDKGYDFQVYDDSYNEKRNLFIYKHRQELGFVNEAYISRGQINDIAEKFSEYLEFDVNEKDLTEYIKSNYPIKENYIKLIKDNSDKFPTDEIYKDKDLKEDGEGYYDSWYNARFLQTIKAFPVYKRLLEEYNATNFAHIQSKALEILKKDIQTQYKHILVDEFQDTDPIQIQIFEILMNEAIKDNKENCVKGTFTAVGDMNQNIYGFRGAVVNYFDKFQKDYECERLSIDYNYRSTNQIVELSEALIKPQRTVHSKQDIKAAKDISKDSYYMMSLNPQDEAHDIGEVIEHLVENKKAEYKDILILFRSVLYDSKDLVEEFINRGIPYHIRGTGKLEDNDEIKSIICLLDFLVQSNSSFNLVSSNKKDNSIQSIGSSDSIQSQSPVPIHGSWDFLGINGFTGENFNPLWNLSPKTKDILNKIQTSYEKQVLEVGKVVQKRMGAPNRRTFKTMFKHDREVLEEIFKEVHEPVLTNSFLVNIGITDEDDLEFFNKLNKLKEDFFNTDYEDRDSILAVYYKLLDICGYFDEEFVKNPDNKNALENIATLTSTIYNYEKIIDKSDIRGLYWYLSSNLKNYPASSVDTDGVQIMTVHEAKGLEYPVTIIASLRDGKFPKEYEDPAEAHRGKEPYYVPNEFFNYKLDHSQEEVNHNEEEIRILYVGITRAQDTLILSSIPKSKKSETLEMPEVLSNLINENRNLIKKLSIDNLDIIEDVLDSKTIEEDEKLLLSYSSIKTYKACPLAYHLKNDFKFKETDNNAINYGNIVHNSLEKINNLIIEGKSLSEDDIKLIVAKTYDNYSNIINNSFKKQETIENVLDYWNQIGKNIKILESEYEFSLYREDYTLNGAIDLIYEINDGNIGIVDYKNAKTINDYKLNSYKDQIYTYINALKEDPKYQNKEVKEAFIYGTILNKRFDINLDNVKINTEKETINITSNQIKSEEFDKKVNKHCEWCIFNFICLKKRCPTCGKPILDYMDYCSDCSKDIVC